MDSLDIGLRNAKGTTYTVIAVVLCLLAGFFVACFFFYQIVVPIVLGTLTLGFMLSVILGMKGVSRAKRKRIQQGRQI
jgi:cobalamin biosynthesis protein CobD/CbiB